MYNICMSHHAYHNTFEDSHLVIMHTMQSHAVNILFLYSLLIWQNGKSIFFSNLSISQCSLKFKWPIWRRHDFDCPLYHTACVFVVNLESKGIINLPPEAIYSHHITIFINEVQQQLKTSLHWQHWTLHLSYTPITSTCFA